MLFWEASEIAEESCAAVLRNEMWGVNTQSYLKYNQKVTGIAQELVCRQAITMTRKSVNLKFALE
jgi:hypothetical protein